MVSTHLGEWQIQISLTSPFTYFCVVRGLEHVKRKKERKKSPDFDSLALLHWKVGVTQSSCHVNLTFI